MPLIRPLDHIPLRNGISLPELLVGIGLIWLMVTTLTPRKAEIVPGQKLELATSRLTVWLTKAMRKADQDGSCSISLSMDGWGAPLDSSIQPCLDKSEGRVDPGLGVGITTQLRHNFPDPAVLTINPRGNDPRISPIGANLIVLSVEGTSLQRCVVIGQLLGLIRIGRYEGSKTGEVQPAQCIAEPAT